MTRKPSRRGSAPDDPALRGEQRPQPLALVALDLDRAVRRRAAGAAGALELGGERARNAALRGRPATTVTLLPPRPFFSRRSTQVIFAGTASSAAFEHRQSSAGHPHFGQTRPLPVW